METLSDDDPKKRATMHDSPWQPGQRVQVKSGLLIGLEGVISRVDGNRLLIVVDFAHQGVVIRIGAHQVERV
jgi:transcription antitermination factor NusG